MRRCGERALLLEIAGGHERVHGAAAAARAAFGNDLQEIVPGDRTLLVVGRARVPDAAQLLELVAGSGAAGHSGRGPERVELQVRYDGPDLAEVAALTRMSVEEVARRHAGADYLVAFVGFAPGFAYLVGGDPLLEVPRRADPRPRIPAGSVAIAGPYSAVYPAVSPGGWRLLGTTDTVLFDPAAGSPALLDAGDRVRFVATR